MAENAKWYVIHTYSGYENAVKAAIEKSVVNRGMSDGRLHGVLVEMCIRDSPGGGPSPAAGGGGGDLPGDRQRRGAHRRRRAGTLSV